MVGFTMAGVCMAVFACVACVFVLCLRVWPVRCGRCGPVRGGCVWPCVVGFTMAGVACVAVRVWPVWRCVCEKRGGPWRAPLCGVQAAVSYSPTPWRVQYHRRWQS